MAVSDQPWKPYHPLTLFLTMLFALITEDSMMLLSYSFWQGFSFGHIVCGSCYVKFISCLTLYQWDWKFQLVVLIGATRCFDVISLRREIHAAFCVLHSYGRLPFGEWILKVGDFGFSLWFRLFKRFKSSQVCSLVWLAFFGETFWFVFLYSKDA